MSRLISLSQVASRRSSLSAENDTINITITETPFQVTIYTGCPKKKFPMFLEAITPLKMALRTKVGLVLKSSGPQLSDGQ